VNEKRNIALPIILMLAFALTRWPGFFPGDWSNFSAAYALLFCAGVYFPKALAWWLPLATMFATSVLLNLFYYKVPVVSGYVVATLFSQALIIWVGRQFSQRDGWGKLVTGGIMGAIVFYLVSNTAAWIYEPTQPYPRTFSGWIQALTVGTSGWPETWRFFRNTLLSGGIFTGLFVGIMKVTQPASEQDERSAEKPLPEDPEEPASDPKAAAE
jgi:hypothetical protein